MLVNASFLLLLLQSSKAAYDAHHKYCVKKFEGPSIRVPEDDVKSFDDSKRSNDPRCFKLALIGFADFEALQVPPASKCSCDEGVLPPATLEELEDEMLEEEMLIMEAHELWAELDDLLDMIRQYNVDDVRPSLKRKLSASSAPPLRRRIRPLSKKDFVLPSFPRRLPSSNSFFGPFVVPPKTEEEREEEVWKMQSSWDRQQTLTWVSRLLLRGRRPSTRRSGETATGAPATASSPSSSPAVLSASSAARTE